MSNKERIVVIGGGFAGINFIKKLDKKRFDVLLVDKNNYHSFPPLFYQIASSGLDPGSISFPFRREMRKGSVKGARYNMGDVKTIDVANKTITTQFETIEYDKLVIAAGTTNNFFGMTDLYKRVFTLKSTPEAIRCRNEILDRLERASLCKDEKQRRRILSFVVIGGGPTGVEIAGAIGEMKRYILHREYPNITTDDLNITLIEGTDRLLRTMSETASREALEYLGHLMVNVKLQKTMKSYENNVVTFADGEQLYSEMVIWTAGVTGEPMEIIGTDFQRGPGNRFIVDEYNRVKGLNEVYALGDISLMMCDAYPKGHPQLAQVAIQQAKLLAKHLNKNEFKTTFKYVDKGSMATVGRNRAVADLKHIHLYGRPAWLTWMFVHLISILGMRNKISVLMNWIWAYCTYSTSLRLLIHSNKYPLRSRWGEKE
ncbi:MAG: NAD(P)/FAD-dependent oxidoreductase [Muribaculaceae bacterium]|nr:NAD(P)/FAD-dependent oxidoreductase [Muribaculaceae bacterium]